MRRIGLTGNIGTGKSTVARIFEILGVPVYHADLQARKLLESDDVKIQIKTLFGESILNAENQIDRKSLAAIVFNNTTKLETLNNLIHPLVEEDFLQWCSVHSNKSYVIHEAAILFESGFDKLFDKNILVTAPETICISRVMARDSITKEMVLARMRNQWQQENKQKLADYQIVNDDNSMVLPQVLAIHKLLKETVV